MYGPASGLGKEWGRQRHEELDLGEIEAVLDALRVHAPQDNEARKCIDYLQRNRELLREVPGRRAVHLHRSGRGRMQSDHRHALQAGRDALNRGRSRRYHCPALL